MSRRNIISILFIIFALLILILLIFSSKISYQWLEVIYAALLAVIVGLVVEFIYKRYSAKSKMLKTTITPPTNPIKHLAKLVLKEKHEILIKEYERLFGREDFIGLAEANDLLFVGKEHFKITRQDDGFYIEDLNTKNGTLLNNNQIKGLEKQKLVNGDEIIVAKTLKFIYFEENI
jgi:FHA domain